MDRFAIVGAHASTSIPVDPLLTVLAELGVVLVLAIALGQAAHALRLPAITGQLLAGVILGPTVLGRVLHSTQASLFPILPTVKFVRTDFLQIGLLVFIFLVGLEVDPASIGRRARTIVPASAFGLVIPFACGFGLVTLLPHLFYTNAVANPEAVRWIVGVALSISALPVIASILKDLGLLRTEIGTIILSAGVLDDLCGWVAFAAVAAYFTGTHAAVWQTILIVFALFGAALALGRQIGGLADTWIARHSGQASLLLGVALAVTLLLSAWMQKVGAHAFFGALIVGIILARVRKDVFAPVDDFVRSFFVPLYFGAVGLSIDFIGGFNLLLVLIVLLIACGGKLLGVGIGSRLGGCGGKQSMAIAFGMNARGSVEILLATLALSTNLIDTHVFEAIVVMAVVTSLVAGAAIPRILNVERPAKLVRSSNPVLQELDAEGRPIEEIEIGPRLTIGRDLSNRFAVPDDQLMSREHAVIRRVNSHFRVEDLGSVNGTLIWRALHWQPVTLEDMQDGDIIVMGSTVCRFSRGAQD